MNRFALSRRRTPSRLLAADEKRIVRTERRIAAPRRRGAEPVEAFAGVDAFEALRPGIRECLAVFQSRKFHRRTCWRVPEFVSQGRTPVRGASSPTVRSSFGQRPSRGCVPKALACAAGGLCTPAPHMTWHFDVPGEIGTSARDPIDVGQSPARISVHNYRPHAATIGRQAEP